MITKVELRQQMRQQLSNITKDDFQKQCSIVHKSLFEQTEWQKAVTIGITLSRGREIDTSRIIERAWEENKKVVVPKCIPDSKELQFRTLTSYDQLEKVYFGLREPIVAETTFVDPTHIDLIIVPGLLYDHDGYRIGFGGGYYDRFLAHYNGQTLSLALDEQIQETLPHETFDIPVQKIITPNKIIRPDVD